MYVIKIKLNFFLISGEHEVRAALITVSARFNMTEGISPEIVIANVSEENQTSSIVNNTIEQSPAASTNESIVVTKPNKNDQNLTLSTISNITGAIETFPATLMVSTISNDYQDNYGLICMPPSKYERHRTYS